MRRILPLTVLLLVFTPGLVLSGLIDKDDQWDRLGKLPHKEYREALKTFKEGLEKEKAEDRKTAIKTFGALEDYRVIRELAKLFKNRDGNVRLAAAEALVTIRDYRAASELTSQIRRFKRSKADSKTLATIVVGLGRLNYRPAASKIADLLDSHDPALTEAACRALADIVPVQYVPAIIKQYEEDKEELEKAEKRKDNKRKKDLERATNAEFRALRSITGESFSDPSDFKKWWRKNAALFEAYGGLKDGAKPRPIKAKKDADW
jgi:hypothetical protein